MVRYEAMQSRISFNGGEWSPEMGTRVDLETYPRGCEEIVNWELRPEGGVSKRKGFRNMGVDSREEMRIFPYVYSYAEGEGDKYVVLCSMESAIGGIRVCGVDGEVIAVLDGYATRRTRVKQVNKLLFFLDPGYEPQVLERKDDGTWSFGAWEYKHHPWRYEHEEREQALYVTGGGSEGYAVDFREAEDGEKPDEEHQGEPLRLSHYVDRRVVKSTVNAIATSMPWAAQSQYGDYTAPATMAVGTVLGFWEQASYDTIVYSCVEDFPKENYREGLESPGNYTSNFVLSTEQNPVNIVVDKWYIRRMADLSGKVLKGQVVVLLVRNWAYYTVRKRITSGMKFVGGPAAHPDYFVRGALCGSVVPCKGAWSTYFSGVWYGAYEVRKNYETADPYGEGWQTCGVSESHALSPRNLIVSGTEKDELCALGLWITKSREYANNPRVGFPADSCNNSLIVDGFKHDLVLRQEVGAWQVVGSGLFKPVFKGEQKITDWSWYAFSARYGGPVACDVYQQRLVFAGTATQPQTVWMSRVDDLDNFMGGDGESDAIQLTMATTSQNPICWIQSKGDVLLLGTSEGEWAISAAPGANFNTASARVNPHSYIGSAESPALLADNQVLFRQRGRQRIYQIGYDFESDGFVSRDVSLFAAHIGREHGGFTDRFALRKVPYISALFVLGDGELALLSYNPMQEVKAWHRWASPAWRFTDVCVLPGGDGDDLVFALGTSSGRLYTLLKYSNDMEGDDSWKDAHLSVSSQLVTTALNNPLEQMVERSNDASFKVKLGADFELDYTHYFTISTNGEHWYEPDRSGKMAKGWHDLKAPGNWQFEKKACVKCMSDCAFEILAIQG